MRKEKKEKPKKTEKPMTKRKSYLCNKNFQEEEKM